MEVYLYSGDFDEVYNLENDPDEMDNLIDSPQYSEKVKELQERIRRRQQFVGSASGLRKQILESGRLDPGRWMLPNFMIPEPISKCNGLKFPHTETELRFFTKLEQMQ